MMRLLTSMDERMLLLFLVCVANNFGVAQVLDTNSAQYDDDMAITPLDENANSTSASTENTTSKAGTTIEDNTCKVQPARVILRDTSGIIRYPNEKYGSGKFTITCWRHTDRVVFYIYELQDGASVEIDNEKVVPVPGRKVDFVSKKSTVEVNFRKDTLARGSLFYRIMDIGEFGDDVMKMLCREEEDICYHSRLNTTKQPGSQTQKSRPPVKNLLLTFPTRFMSEHKNEVSHHINLKEDNGTMAVIDIDPKRISIADGDKLNIGPCNCNESATIISINSPRGKTLKPRERRILRFYGDNECDLCVKFLGSKKHSNSEWVLPTQLVKLVVKREFPEKPIILTRTFYPEIHLFLWPKHSEIIDNTSRFCCRISK